MVSSETGHVMRRAQLQSCEKQAGGAPAIAVGCFAAALALITLLVENCILFFN